MILHFNKDLSRQDVYANGVELASLMGMDRDVHGNRVRTWPKDVRRYVYSFDDPVLVTDNHRIGNITNPTLRDTLFALMGSAVKTTDYDGTSIDFEQRRFPGVWGPSIDTLLFCRALDKLDPITARTAAEIGCGSGFISKRVLERAYSLRGIELVDIDKLAVECAKENLQDPRALFHQQDGIEFLKGRAFDMILCNPPYIPRPKSIDDNPYEGLSLAVYLVDNARDILTDDGVMVVNISSLGEGLVMPRMKDAGVAFRKIDEMEVPLKVYNVLNNMDWIDFLMQRGLKREMRQGYEFWHTLNIYEIRTNDHMIGETRK